MPNAASPPVVLTIAGSDNSAGAGAQADLKTFTAAGVYGLTALTCVVAEAPGRVEAIHPVPTDVVRRQLRLSAEFFPLAAVKTGLLASADIVSLVADWYSSLPMGSRRPPLVVDPVMVASSGDSLLPPTAVRAYAERLFPLATLVTPNLDEAAVLLGRPVKSLLAMRLAGRDLAGHWKCAVLLKGGHLGGDTAHDLLFLPNGESRQFSAPFVPGVSTHGTGCTYSAAIAACLALGLSLEEAVRQAKAYVSGAIRHFFRWPRANGPAVDALNHFSIPT